MMKTGIARVFMRERFCWAKAPAGTRAQENGAGWTSKQVHSICWMLADSIKASNVVNTWEQPFLQKNATLLPP